MLGFVAEARSTEITIDYGELEDARWFARDWLSSRTSTMTLSACRAWIRSPAA
jgi:NADH pyrophosphatase NudC (nudix superfamily)